jgi:NADH-quinone oxidoreductase subunit N
MVLAGFFYKLAVFPMHFWVPDIYQGASMKPPVLSLLSLKFACRGPVDPFSHCYADRSESLSSGELLALISVCSMFYGNLSALVQKDIKRMLGFSGIAHAGFITAWPSEHERRRIWCCHLLHCRLCVDESGLLPGDQQTFGKAKTC